MRVFNRRGNRIRPLLDLHGQWLDDRSTYPDELHVAMRDGRVVRYGLLNNPMRLCVGKHGWQSSGYVVVGYQYRAEKKTPLKKMTSFLQRVGYTR